MVNNRQRNVARLKLFHLLGRISMSSYTFCIYARETITGHSQGAPLVKIKSLLLWPYVYATIVSWQRGTNVLGWRGTVVHLLEHNSMWIRARGAWVEQTPTTNMCHSINRMAHYAGLLPIILCLEYPLLVFIKDHTHAKIRLSLFA